MRFFFGYRRLVCLGGFFALVAVAAPQSAEKPAVDSPASVAPGYRIGAGDVLGVVVWKEPEASVPDVTVRPDGKISIPLLGELEVQGRTTSELQKIIAQKLVPFIKDADVTVLVRSVQSEKIYVLGAVRREGAVKLTGPMTVLQALSEAGGMSEYAKRTKVYILRMESGKQVKIPFNYKEVLSGKHPEQNILVQPGDTIVVPQ